MRSVRERGLDLPELEHPGKWSGRTVELDVSLPDHNLRSAVATVPSAELPRLEAGRSFRRGRWVIGPNVRTYPAATAICPRLHGSTGSGPVESWPWPSKVAGSTRSGIWNRSLPSAGQ
jgi:hypothetical protein